MNTNKNTVSAMLRNLRSGELDTVGIVEQTIQAFEDNEDINAVISTDYEGLRKQAQSLHDSFEQNKNLPLYGVPILVKDNIDTVDFKTTGATPILKDHQPKADAGVIRKLKDAGAIIAGKANMHELAFGITSNNGHSGAVRNPYNKELIPGGSSGGSAAAVSAGMVAASLGSDTGGSNRIPAGLCGICGFRPSTGRYPGDGLINLSLTRDTVGIFAHTVTDIALIDAVLADTSHPASEVDLKQLRLAVPKAPAFKAIENETVEVIDAALAQLAEGGVTLVEVDMSEMLPLNDKVSFPTAFYETIRELKDYLQRNLPQTSLDDLIAAIASPDVKHLMQAASGDQKIPEQVYQDAIQVYRPKMQQLYADYFEKNNIDGIVYATTPLTARPIGDDETVEVDGERLPTFPSYVRNGDPSSNAGIPSLSIPAGLSKSGLPVGLSIDGPVAGDEKVLAIGSALQGILPPIPGPKT